MPITSLSFVLYTVYSLSAARPRAVVERTRSLREVPA
jgi:hypothetical protein